jgi:prefoldin subunit 5
MAQMSQRLESNAEVTAGAAKEILKQAGDWSDRSATQIEQMLNAHQQQVARVEDLRVAFTSALGDFSEAIGKHSMMINGLGEIAGQVTATVEAINRSMLGIQSAQQALERVATETRIQAEHLAKANGYQEEIWGNIELNLNRYNETFVQVEQAAQALLSQINDQLNNYTRATQNGFQKLVEMADNHFSNATNRLGASVGELDEVLSDLADTLGKTRSNGKR